MKYQVEYLDGAMWIRSSRHKNEVNAIINADVLHSSRGCPARVIYEGKVVWASSQDS